MGAVTPNKETDLLNSPALLDSPSLPLETASTPLGAVHPLRVLGRNWAAVTPILWHCPPPLCFRGDGGHFGLIFPVLFGQCLMGHFLLLLHALPGTALPGITMPSVFPCRPPEEPFAVTESEWFVWEGTLKHILSHSLPWAGASSTRPGCSKPHPTWPWML